MHAQVMLSNGTVVVASASANADLLWAIRGGGPFYGIVLEWTLKVIKAPALVTTLTYSWSNADSSTAAKVRGVDSGGWERGCRINVGCRVQGATGGPAAGPTAPPAFAAQVLDAWNAWAPWTLPSKYALVEAFYGYTAAKVSVAAAPCPCSGALGQAPGPRPQAPGPRPQAPGPRPQAPGPRPQPQAPGPRPTGPRAGLQPS
jgi:hypothetical protein